MDNFDDNVVEATVVYMAEIFRKHYIVSPELQRTVARMILSEETVYDYSSSYLSMMEAFTGSSFNAIDPTGIKRQRVNVTAGLTSQQKSALDIDNDDVDVVYYDTMRMPHGKSYAQRIIDTTRLSTGVPKWGNGVMDIGGNWTIYARRSNGFAHVHCCNLRKGQIEEHRQVQRETNMHLEGIVIPEALKCNDGVGNCGFQATHAYSLHVLPEIDPDSWVEIFSIHGLESATHIYHYDTDIEQKEDGYIAAAEMYWRTMPDDRLEFYFDNDSSHPYNHKKSWVIKYAQTFVVTRPDVDFVIWSQVDFIKSGRAQVSMLKMKKDSLGQQDLFYQHRYHGGEGTVDIAIPKFDETKGLVITDPNAYALSWLRIPSPMFEYLYRVGIANDTSDPSKPFSLEDMKLATHSYSYVRTFNGVALTSSVKIPATDLDDIALGMYLAVVLDAAKERSQYGVYTVQMKNVQDRWGANSMAWLFTRTLGALSLLPFAIMAAPFEDFFAMASVYMRSVISQRGVTSTYRYVSPVRELPTVVIDTGEVYSTPVFENYNKNTSALDLSSPADVQKFYDMFKEILPLETKLKIEEYLEKEYEFNVDQVHDDVEKAAPSSIDVDVGDTRDEWHVAVDKYEELVPLEDVERVTEDNPPRVGTSDQVNGYVKERIIEYALYKHDEHLHTLASAVTLCRDTWAGHEPNFQKCDSENAYNDYGIRYFRCRNGIVVDMLEDNHHGCVINPYVNPPSPLVVKIARDNNRYIGDQHIPWVFTCTALQIYNAHDISKKAINLANNYVHTDRVWELVNAVAGAGKTYTIVNDFTEADVVVCAVKSTADDTYAEIMNLKLPDGTLKFAGKGALIRRRIRSNDSAVMHDIPRARVLFADEGMMVHGGQLHMIAAAVRARKVRVFGDETQIGMIERGSKLLTLRLDSLLFWTQMTYVNETVRLPADALKIHATFHTSERAGLLRTYNPVLRSIKWRKVSNAEAREFKHPRKGVTFMSILRTDKGVLVGADGFYDGKKTNVTDKAICAVFTVHEAQGRSEPAWLLARINAKTVGVLNSKPHQNVAFTRHMYNLDVVTTKGPDEDPLARLAILAESYTDDELRAVQLPAPEWLKLRISKIENMNIEKM